MTDRAVLVSNYQSSFGLDLVVARPQLLLGLLQSCQNAVVVVLLRFPVQIACS